MARFQGMQLLIKRVLVLSFMAFTVATVQAGNDILGEIQLEGATKVERTSGVWVDGQYLGYLRDLKGSKKILLLSFWRT
jgi:hypothetical protein